MNTTKPKIYWVAHYDNGEIYEQGNYQDIDRDRLVAFSMYGEGDRLLVAIDFVDDSDGKLGPKRLIWRRRTQVSNKGSTPIHLVGWQRNVNGVNVQSICYINELTEQIILAGQWQPNRPFMHGVQLREYEK